MLRSAFRRLLGIPAPVITAADALGIARDEGARRGWYWWDKQKTTEGLRDYTVTVGDVSPHESWWHVRVGTQDGRIVKAGIAHEWRNPSDLPASDDRER